MDAYINLGEVRATPNGLQMSVVINGYDPLSGEMVNIGTIYRVDFALSEEANRAAALALGQAVAMANLSTPYILQVEGPREEEP